jgi:hypothetical protein
MLQNFSGTISQEAVIVITADEHAGLA